MSDFINIENKTIHVWMDNNFLCCNYFKDPTDGYNQKKNVFFETKIDVMDGYVELGTRLVNNELDELLITTNFDWRISRDAFKED